MTVNEAANMKGYWGAVARRYFLRFPNMVCFTLLRRGGTTGVHFRKPEARELIYVASTRGRYGRSHSVRLGSGVTNAVVNDKEQS